MNHALTFVLQMDWLSDNQYNQNWSKLIYIILDVKLNKHHIKGIEKVTNFQWVGI